MTTLTREIARAFTDARRAGRALHDFPGAIPDDLDTAYRIQDAAIELWPDTVSGWKIGRVPPSWVGELGADRLAGPIFSKLVWPGSGPVAVPVFDGGFSAVEAEFVYRMGRDAPAGKTEWTADDARDYIATLHVGVEMAGSPLAAINALGPKVVVSDFGNNHGLIVGPEVPNWRERRDDDLAAETFIDGQNVGKGGAFSVYGGPLASVVFLLEHLARRGRPLKAGQYISTGAATGIHDFQIGQSARVVFAGIGEIECAGVKAAPRVEERV